MADYDLQYQDTHIDALLATANELKTAGYIYKGVATPSTNPGTPTERVAYLASEPGTYTNFGGIVIASGLYSLTYAGGTWTGTQMQAGSDIEVVQEIGQSASDVMSQKAVTEAFKSVQMPDVEGYSSTLSVPSKAQFRIILPFNFVVGETYNIEVSTANAVSQSVRYYVYQSGQYSNNTNNYLGEIPAGGTTAKTTYTPVSETNYQFFGFWNNNNAATSVDVTITKKQATNKVVSDMQDVVASLQLKEFFNDHLPDLEVLDYDIYDTKNLNIHDCVVDANNKWYKTTASQGQNAKHVVVPVTNGSIVIMRGNYDVMQFWLNSSYNPNTTYNSGSSAPIVGSRQFIGGTDAVLYTPTDAAYFAISIVFGDYSKSLMPDEIIVVKDYINKVADEIDKRNEGLVTSDVVYNAFEGGYTDSDDIDILTEYDVSNLLVTGLFFRTDTFTDDTTTLSSLLLPYVRGAKIVSVTSNVSFRTNELKGIPKNVVTPYMGLKATWVAGADYGTGTRVFTLNAQTERMQLQFRSIDASTILNGTTSIKIYYENHKELLHDTDIVDNTIDGGAEKVLSAEQGKVLNEKINNLTTEVEHLTKAWFDVDEDGLFFVDKYQNIGAKFDSNGFHAININE